MGTEITGKERFEKVIRRKEKLTTYLYDLSKAVFTIMVLTDFAVWFSKGFNLDVMFSAIFGCLTSFLLAYYANRILKY